MVCYERLLAKNPSLEGKLKVRVRLDARGNVVNYALVADTLHADDTFYACVHQMLTSAVAPGPQGDCIDVTIPMSYVPTPTDAGAAAKVDSGRR